MVTELFLNLLKVMVGAFVDALPAWDLVADNSAFDKFIWFVTAWDGVLPISELLAMLSLASVFFVCLHALKWGKAGLNLIRGSGA